MKGRGRPVGKRNQPKVELPYPFKDLPETKYDVILMDPPWDYGAATCVDYETLTMEELKLIPTRQMLWPNGLLFLWATSPKLKRAMELLDAWNMEFRGVAFVWVKTRKDGVPFAGRGMNPTVTKPNCEFVLVASKTKYGRPMPLASLTVPQTIMSPPRESGRKPAFIKDWIEEMYPKSKRLEMFARQTYPGWDAWGNETTKFNV